MLGFFNKNSGDNEQEQSEKMFHYEGVGSTNENEDEEEDLIEEDGEQNADSEDHEETTNETENKTPSEQEKEALKKAQKKAKELEEHSHGDYEQQDNFLEKYKEKYNEKVVDKTTKLTHDIIFMLSNNVTKPSEWEGFSSKKMLSKVAEMDKDVAFLDFQIVDMELVPIDKEFDGIVIGVLLETHEGVHLLEFDFLIKGNEPILDDINLAWSY